MKPWTRIVRFVEERRPIRTVAATPAARLGVTSTDLVPHSTELEEALGSNDGLVVVTGPSSPATHAALHRAMRLMLGNDTLIVVTDPHDVDLVATLQRARDHAPAVVLVPDAPTCLLERVTPALRALVDAEVRLVITTRPSLLGAFIPAEAETILATATVEIPGAEIDRGEPVDAELSALVGRVVAQRDALGVCSPLGLEELRRTVRSTEEAMERAVTEARRAGLVRHAARAGQDHLAPGPAAHDFVIPETYGRGLAKVVPENEVARAGRIALARDEVGLAVALLDRMPNEALPLPAAEALARACEARTFDDAAVRWYLVVAAGDDPAAASRARRSAGLIEHRRGLAAAAELLLAEAGREETDLEVQDILGRRALQKRSEDDGALDEARRRLRLVAGGDDDRAVAAAAELAWLAIEAGRDDEAQPLLQRAAQSHDASVALRARVTLALDLARSGCEADAVEALSATRDLSGRLPVAMATAWAEFVRGRGDLDEAARALRCADTGGIWDPVLVVTVLELDVERERWSEIAGLGVAGLAALGGGPIRPQDGAHPSVAIALGPWDRAGSLRRQFRGTPPNLIERLFKACAKAEFALGHQERGQLWLEALKTDGTPVRSRVPAVRNLPQPLTTGPAPATVTVPSEAEKRRVAQQQAAQRAAIFYRY